MPYAIRIHETGAPDVMTWEEVDVPPPAGQEVQLRHSAIGVNFIDVYHRSGLYPLESLPATIGMEAAGVVEAVGPGVEGLQVGMRVAYAAPPVGAYCQVRNIAADQLVALPDEIDDTTAAAMMLKGLTAQYLLRQTHPVHEGEAVLVTAAAGGIGLILCQWAKHLGANVIGMVGSEEKAALARQNGCDHVIVQGRDDMAEGVMAATRGEGASVIYDGVGKASFEGSLASLSLFGHLVSYGQASGAVAPFDMGLLSAKSATLTRPVLFHYTARREDLLAMAKELFEVVLNNVVKVSVKQTFPLKEAAKAHLALEARQTTGSTVLLP